MIVGHAKAVEALEKDLPPVVLLMGPASVGKRTIARHVAERYGAKKHTTLTTEKLLRAESDLVTEFCSTAPMAGLKFVVIDLDGASPEAVNGLLKLLEEPPHYVRFILTASRPVLLTVLSRATTYRLGYLSENEVYAVLHDRFKMAPEDARAAARVSGGQVKPAMDWQRTEQAKGPVVNILKATATGDDDLLHNALQNFGDEQLMLLQRWCTEAISKSWRTFSPDESFGLQNLGRTVRVMDRALHSGARPKIAAKSALLPVLEANRGK